MHFLKFRKYNTKNIRLVLSLFILFFLLVLPKAEAQKKYVVILDAGHGGKDPGASNGKFIEKKIVLKVALEIGKQLQKNKNIKVIYTRNDDTFVELHKRANIANQKDATLFVSLHCDSFKPNPKAYGASTYVLGLRGNAANMEIAKRENAVILLEDNYKQNYDYDPNSPESVIGLSVLQEENLDASLGFASTVQSNFIKAKRKDRSVKQANFLVLRETVMPSVLIELGFLSNYKEGKYLNSKEGQIKIATAIAKAISGYVKRLKLNTVGNFKQVAEKTETKVKTTPKEVKKKKETPKRNIVDAVEKTKVIPKQHPVKKKTKVVKQQPKKGTLIEFKVQIAASKKYIEPKSYNFKGLKDIEVKVVDEYYKYYYKTSSDFTMVKKYLQEAKKAGIKGVFVVAFENGVKIPLREAIKKQ